MLSLKLIIHKAPYFLILLLLTTVSDKVFAQKLDSKLENREVIFEANEIQVNQQEGTIIAEGDVLFDQGQYKLTADKVIYNQLADIGNAYGNVVVKRWMGLYQKLTSFN